MPYLNPEVLNVMRRSRGLTRNQLAELADVSRCTVWKAQHGHRLSGTTARKLQAALEAAPPIDPAIFRP